LLASLLMVLPPSAVVISLPGGTFEIARTRTWSSLSLATTGGRASTNRAAVAAVSHRASHRRRRVTPASRPRPAESSARSSYLRYPPSRSADNCHVDLAVPELLRRQFRSSNRSLSQSWITCGISSVSVRVTPSSAIGASSHCCQLAHRSASCNCRRRGGVFPCFRAPARAHLLARREGVEPPTF
jgi:hypothetical protein